MFQKRKKTVTLVLSLALLLTMVLVGCNANSGQQQPAPPETTAPQEQPKEPVTLMVSAAASLTDVCSELAEIYKGVAPHVTLTHDFDSSGALQVRIEEGAEVDVFISAAQKQMNALEEKGLLAQETRKNLLENKVVLIVPENSDLAIQSFEDAATDKVSLIAIGEASVPVGQYTEEIYTYLNLWDQIQAKASFGTNVRQVLSWVETAEADCGIVYATDAASTAGVKIMCEAPAGSHQPVIYPVSALAASKNLEEAQAYIDFLTSPEAVKAFEAAGFVMSR